MKEKAKPSYEELELRIAQLEKKADELAKIEKKLNEKTNFIQTMIKSLPGIFYMYDDDYSLVEWNENLEKASGYTSHELERRNVFEWFSKDELHKIEKGIKKVFKDDHSHSYIEANLILKHGDKVPHYLTGRSLEIEGRKYLLGFGFDISPLKKLEIKLKNTIKEKDVLLQEIHHRVYNNLQVLSGLLSMHEDVDQQVLLKKILFDIQNRIHTIAGVHNRLSDSEDYSRIDFRKYLQELVENYPITSLSNGKTKVVIRLNADDVRMNLYLAVPCGLIINELVSNAVRHAFTKNGTGIISLSIKKEENNFTINVTDNGNGFPREVEFWNPRQMGLKLVHLLNKQLQGTIEFSNATGTSITITFPDRPYKGPIVNLS